MTRDMNLPDPLPITPIPRPVRATIRVPGSKSYTNRALPIAALARGESILTGVLDSEDTQVMMAALRSLGIVIEHDPKERLARIQGCDGSIPAREARLFLANSGTSMRFLTAIVSVGHGRFTLDGVPRMRERPIGDLLAALNQIGIVARSLTNNDCPPLEIQSNGLGGGQISIRADVSSQFLSGLLIAGVLSERPLEISVDGPIVSTPYIEMTLATISAFHGRLTRDAGRVFRFPGRHPSLPGYLGVTYAIEPDASAASYFFAAAAITGGSVTVPGLGNGSLQGDLQFVRLLEQMGCTVHLEESETTLVGGLLHGIDVDMRDVSDTVPTLAAVACFAAGPTHIRNVGHIRHKETDRIAALAAELRKTGCRVDERTDGLSIYPSLSQSAVFDTYGDHRMAMALALIGLRHPGIAIRDPSCVGKTYPAYFSDFAQLAKY